MCLDCSAVLLWFRARWSDAVTDKDLSPPWPNWQSPFSGAREGNCIRPHKRFQEWRHHPRLYVCVSFVFFQTGPSDKPVPFFYLHHVCSFYLHFVLCLFKVDDLLRATSQRSSTELASAPILSLCVEMDCFSVCGCSWTPASCIWYLQYLLSQWELNWKPLSCHHYGSFSPRRP